MTAPKPGDRVRVVIEGTVTAAHEGTLRINTGEPGLFAQIIDPRCSGVSVEVLPPPEPHWWPPQPGDVVRVWGATYLRSAVAEDIPDWVNGAGLRLSDEGLLAEIRKGHDQDYGYPQPALLLRYGKPVAPTGIVTVVDGKPVQP